jgi:hypothetical protein
VSRRAAAALGVAVAAVALAAWLGYRALANPTPGPLASDVAESLGIQRRVGETFTYGMPVVINSGDESAVLSRIEPVDPTPGLRLVDTRIAGSERRFFYFASGSWPDPSRFTDLHPVPGFVVPPANVAGWERGAELIFVLRADEPGRYAFDAVAVEYRVGGREHRAVLDIGLGVCVTNERRLPDERCDDPPTDLGAALRPPAWPPRAGRRAGGRRRRGAP